MVSTPVIHGLLLIYRPGRDERLSWPSWLTHSGRLTHKVVTRQPSISRRSGKVRRLQTDVLTTEPPGDLFVCLAAHGHLFVRWTTQSTAMDRVALWCLEPSTGTCFLHYSTMLWQFCNSVTALLFCQDSMGKIWSRFHVCLGHKN